MKNLLCLYNSYQTYTDTVYQHVSALGKHSRHRVFFAHHDQDVLYKVDLSRFDAVIIHYSVRLPYNQISPAWIEPLANFPGCKALFIQDEYDHTHRSWYWIQKLGIQLVFSVVPDQNLPIIYPTKQFPSTRFVSVLTGYVPDSFPLSSNLPPPSQRTCWLGYRGRPLPIRYGRLGQEKIAIGAMVKEWCETHNIKCDIEWSEEARIYGPAWFKFIAGCRAMLGSESGCNVFDWEGDLEQKIKAYRDRYPQASEESIYGAVVAPTERNGLMNQISPRVFETIALRSVLILFEGNYSGVLEPGRHYIALKKDGSNLRDVFAQLQDGKIVDSISDRAYSDIISSEKYSYKKFVGRIDQELENELLRQS
jgi:hypothetical protein